jgi:hypothetical protein
LRSSPSLTELLLSALLRTDLPLRRPLSALLRTNLRLLARRYGGPPARLFAVLPPLSALLRTDLPLRRPLSALLRIRKLLLPLCLAAALLAGGCARQPARPETGTILAGRWYQLADGSFEAVQAPGQPAVAGLPWTVQARISDMSSLDGRLYLAVNGYGLASLEMDRGAAPRFRYFYDPLLFRYRTLTTLVPAAGSLTCHLYFNSLLNLAVAAELPVQGLSLLSLSPQEGVYRQLRMPFERSHQGWEAVGFLPLSQQEFLLEWKLAGPERTLFAYSRYDLASSTERPATRQEYREAWEPRPLEGQLPGELEPLVRELLGRPEGAQASLFLGARSAAEPLLRRYARRSPSGPEPADRLLTAFAFLDGERRLLLGSDGLLLAARAGEAPGATLSARRLPALPVGFQYTGLFVLNGLLLAPWEQADFTTTGAAGIFISGDL